MKRLASAKAQRAQMRRDRRNAARSARRSACRLEAKLVADKERRVANLKAAAKLIAEQNSFVLSLLPIFGFLTTELSFPASGPAGFGVPAIAPPALQGCFDTTTIAVTPWIEGTPDMADLPPLAWPTPAPLIPPQINCPPMPTAEPKPKPQAEPEAAAKPKAELKPKPKGHRRFKRISAFWRKALARFLNSCTSAPEVVEPVEDVFEVAVADFTDRIDRQRTLAHAFTFGSDGADPVCNLWSDVERQAITDSLSVLKLGRANDSVLDLALDFDPDAKDASWTEFNAKLQALKGIGIKRASSILDALKAIRTAGEKTLVVSDLHANINAWNAVEAFVKQEQVTRLVINGDICDGKSKNTVRDSVKLFREVLKYAKADNGVEVILIWGNHDAGTLLWDLKPENPEFELANFWDLKLDSNKFQRVAADARAIRNNLGDNVVSELIQLFRTSYENGSTFVCHAGLVSDEPHEVKTLDDLKAWTNPDDQQVVGWAKSYDSSEGHVIFGHVPRDKRCWGESNVKPDGASYTCIDNGAKQGNNPGFAILGADGSVATSGVIDLNMSDAHARRLVATTRLFGEDLLKDLKEPKNTVAWWTKNHKVFSDYANSLPDDNKSEGITLLSALCAYDSEEWKEAAKQVKYYEYLKKKLAGFSFADWYGIGDNAERTKAEIGDMWGALLNARATLLAAMPTSQNAAEIEDLASNEILCLAQAFSAGVAGDAAQKMVESLQSYSYATSIGFGFVDSNQRSLFKIQADAQGQELTGAALLSRYLPSVANEVVNVKFLGGFDRADTFGSILDNLAKQLKGMVYGRVGSSATLLVNRNGDNKLSSGANLADRLFPQGSDIPAYFSSLFNSTAREPLEGGMDLAGHHNNGATKVVVYHPELLKLKFLNFAEKLGLSDYEEMVAAMSGADGSGLQSIDPNMTGQIRGVIARNLEDPTTEDPAAFFKGLQSYKRVVLNANGEFFTVLDLARQLLEDSEIANADTPIKALKLAIDTWEEAVELGVEAGEYFRFLGIDAGEIKGRGKDEFSRVLDPQADLKSLGKSLTAEKPFVVLDDHSEDNNLRVLCWQIIPSPWDTKQAFNFQPTVMFRKLDGTPFEASSKIEDKLTRGYSSLGDDESDRKFDEAMDRLGLNFKLRKLALANPSSAVWRALTNGTWRDQPTKRLIMSSLKLDGLVVGDDSWFRDKELARTLNYRVPLLVPQALQANAIMTMKKLFQWFELGREELLAREDFKLAYERCKSIHDYRFKGKKGHVAKYTTDFFLGELNKLLNLCALQPLDDRLCIMFCADVAAMQGDDDGDLTVWCTDAAIVEAAIENEKFWMKAFADIPGLRPPSIELDKNAKLTFSKAWTDEEVLKTVGLRVSEDLAKAIMGEGQTLNMIPPPQAFTQRQLFEHWEVLTQSDSFSAFCARIGGNPQGPVGIGSNGAVEVLMNIHFVLNSNTGKLEFADERSAMLWRAYLFMAFAVQTSIDWAKRAYLLLAFWLFGLLDKGGNPVINFNDEIDLGTVKKWNVNEHPELNRVKLVPLDDGTSKIVVGVSNLTEWNEQYGSDVLEFEQYTNHDEFYKDGADIPMIDGGNGCFDVKTLIQPLKALFGRKDYKLFSWKLDKTVSDLVGNQEFRNKFKGVMQVSAPTHFKHSALGVVGILEDDNSEITKQLKAMSPDALEPAFKQGLCENRFKLATSRFSEMEVEVARFFRSLRFGEESVKNSELARIILNALGFDQDSVLNFLSSGKLDSSLNLGDESFTFLEVVKCLGAKEQAPKSDTVQATYWQILLSAFVEKDEASNRYTATLVARVAQPFRKLMNYLASSDKRVREEALKAFADPDRAVDAVVKFSALQKTELSDETKALLFAKIAELLAPFQENFKMSKIQDLAQFYITALKILIMVENARSSYTSLWVDAINWEISEFDCSPQRAASKVASAFSNEFAMFISSLRLATQKGFANDMVALYNPGAKELKSRFPGRLPKSLNLRNVVWGGDFTLDRFLEGVREFKRPSVGWVYPMEPYAKMLGFAQAVAKQGNLVMSHYLFRNIGIKTAYDIAFIRAVAGDFALNGKRYFLTPQNPAYTKWTPGTFDLKTFEEGKRVSSNQVQYIYKMTSHLTKAGCYDSDAQFGKAEQKQVAFACNDIVGNGGEALLTRLFEPRIFGRNPLVIAGSTIELLDGPAWLERLDKANEKKATAGKKFKPLPEAERNEIASLGSPDLDPRWFLRQLNGRSNLKNNTYGFRTFQGMLAEGMVAKHLVRQIANLASRTWGYNLSADGFAFKILYDADWSHNFSKNFTVENDDKPSLNLLKQQRDVLGQGPTYKLAGTYVSKGTSMRVMFDSKFGLSNYELNDGKNLDPADIRKSLKGLILKAQLFDYIMQGYSLQVDYAFVDRGSEFSVDGRVLKTESVHVDSDVVFYDDDYEVLDNSSELAPVNEPQRQPEPKREVPMVEILPEDQAPPPGAEPDLSQGLEDVDVPDFMAGLQSQKPAVWVVPVNFTPGKTSPQDYASEMTAVWKKMASENLTNPEVVVVDLFVGMNLPQIFSGVKRPAYKNANSLEALPGVLTAISKENKTAVIFANANDAKFGNQLMQFLNESPFAPKLIG